MSGELTVDAGEVRERTHQLCLQLATDTKEGNKPDPTEMADTALRTLALPDLEPFRHRLVPEMPLYGGASVNANELIAGRADAVAPADNGELIVLDWKSDVVPSARDRAAYREQLTQYLRVLGARRGAVVYMTSGSIDWIDDRA